MEKIKRNIMECMSMVMMRRKSGFSGITHVLISIVLFELMWLIPFFDWLLQDVKSGGIFLIVTFWLTTAGAALLPDLDTNISSAGYALGLLGKLLHTFMVATASLVYNIFKGKNDETLTQHRMFWHTPLSCLLLYGYGFLCYKQIIDQGTIIDCYKTNGLSIILISYSFLFLLDISGFYLALTKLYYNIGRIAFKKAMRPLQFLTITIFIVYLVLKGTPGYLFQLYGAVCLGCLFHIIGDLFSKGSVPLFFPIPYKGQSFYKPRLVAKIETNSTMNRILDMALFITSIVLMILIVKGKDVLINLLS